MPYLECTRLHKRWPDADIDVSFTAERGTLTCLLGASGSGKSTVLRLIAGLIPPDGATEPQGHIILDGEDITRLAPAKRHCGMVFQSGALFPHLTVQDNVAYGLRCAGMGKAQSRERAREFLKEFAMEGFATRWPETLSGGEAQRVALARTLITRPKLVLLDEPLSALDAPLRKKLGGEIRSLQRTWGFTALMVTHDRAEADAMGDAIIQMEKGHIISCAGSGHAGKNML